MRLRIIHFSSWRWLLLILGALALYLIGNSTIPLWDRDEPRYAQCSRQMLQSGDWVVPRWLDELRTHKPPLIYWCQAAAMRMCGDTGFAARLPSALAMTAVVVLLGQFVGRYAGARRALWASFIFATSALTIAAAKMALTDAVLLLFGSISQGCLFILWRRHGRRESKRNGPIVVLLWTSIGLAGLTKGPVVLATDVALLLVLSLLDRRFVSAAPTEPGHPRPGAFSSWINSIRWWKQTRPLTGIIILSILVLPWLLLIHHRAPGFLDAMFNRASRYASTGAEGHAALPGYYLVQIWGTLFPWSLLLPPAIGMGIRHRKKPMLRFALAAVIGPWIVMELLVNKLPFYVLPCFGGLAILTAEAVVRSSCARRGQPDDDLKQNGFFIGVAGWGLALFLLALLPWFVGATLRPANRGSLVLFSTIVILMLVAVSSLFGRRKVAGACIAMGVGMGGLMFIFFGAILPTLPVLQTSRTVAEILKAHNVEGATPVAMIDYREPSLAFYEGGGTREREDGYLTPTIPENWAVLTTAAWSHVPAEIQRHFEIIDAPIPAVVYASGNKHVQVIIVHKRP